MPQTWSEKELEFIIALRNHRNCGTWVEIAEQFNKKFPKNKTTADAACAAYRRYQHLGSTLPVDQAIRSIKQLRQARKASSFNARDARLLADQMEAEGNIVERIEEIAKRVLAHKRTKTLPPLPRKYPKRFDMALELMLSDLHFGLLVEINGQLRFNEAIARQRLRQVVAVVLKEIEIHKAHYNVTRLVVGLLGDIIQSFTMHGLESARSCEYGTAKQVWAAIDSLLFDVFIPLAETGLPIDVPAVTGNHDRSEKKRTYVNPGENNWTLVIYKALEALLKGYGYKNVKFHTPTSAYVILEVFGNNILYEHLDNARLNRDSFEKLIAKRSRQTGMVIDCLRGGHWHEYYMNGNGRVVVNMSLPGGDSFSDTLGYDDGAGQVLNFYLDYPIKLRPGQRRNAFHKTFGIKLS